MVLRCVVLPLVLVAGLVLVFPDRAEATPITGMVAATGPAIHAGVRVDVGLGVVVPRRPAYRRVRPAPGHWVIQRERVWVPGELIGYDVHHRPIYTEGYWTVHQTRVWVPTRPYVRPHVRHVRPYVRPHVRPYPRGRVAVRLRFH